MRLPRPSKPIFFRSWFGLVFWPMVALICVAVQMCSGCSSTSTTVNPGYCVDDAGEEILCNSSITSTAALGSTGGQSSSSTTTSLATGGTGYPSTFGAAGYIGTTGGSGSTSTGGAGLDAATCDLTAYVNWQCGSTSGPSAGAPSGTVGDATPSSQWICIGVDTPVTPPNPTFGDHQTVCFGSDYRTVCYHC